MIAEGSIERKGNSVTRAEDFRMHMGPRQLALHRLRAIPQTLARGAERGGASGSKPIIIINKQARASRQVHIARAPLMTAACATDEAPTRHTRTDVQRRESDDLSTGTGSKNSMDKTLTMARSADSSSGAGARALARRPSNRRQNTSFFRVRVVFRAQYHR